LQSTLEMEFNIHTDEDAFEDMMEEEKEPLSEYYVTLVGITNKLGRLIRLGVTKELAMEFKEYQNKLVRLSQNEVQDR